MDVSVCIVNWNTRDLLCRCIESIRARTEGIEYEIVVVDNNSSDGSGAAIERKFPDVKLVGSTENLGFAKGCNLAVGQSVGNFVLYLNPDTELVSNAIAGMMRLLEKRPDVGIGGCRLLNSDGSIQLTCASAFPSPRNELCSLLGLDRMFPRTAFFSARELGYWDHRDSRDVECLSGACMMLRRELVDRLGGFDVGLFMYGEDLDMCARVAREGLRLHYLASETIYHHEGAGSTKRGPDFAPLRQRAANFYFLQKHFGEMRAAGYRGAVLLGSAARLFGLAMASPFLLAMKRFDWDELSGLFARHGRLAVWAAGIRRQAIGS